MFDIGWTELLVIGVVALIVVGPQDLPKMFRTLGRFTGKAKAMAREFQSAMNEAADQAGVADVADDLRKATSKKSLGLDALDEAASKFENWDPGMGKPKDDPAKKPKKSKKKAKKSAENKADKAPAQKPADSAKPDAPKTDATS
ncbi:MAG: twin-arginine translocase subunit TatB [Rhodobacterales bacterium]|nr:MAG: twin-arginine translocase subunit TatB [Rhodobacterales bacterium]